VLRTTNPAASHTQYFPASSQFLPLCLRYLPQHPVLERRSCVFSITVRDQTLRVFDVYWKVHHLDNWRMKPI